MLKTISAKSLNDWEKYWNARDLGIQTKKIEDLISKIPASTKSLQLNRSFTILANFHELTCLGIVGHLKVIMGYEPIEVLNGGGLKFLFNLVHPDDLNKVAACSIYYQEFIHTLALNKRSGIKASLNFRIKKANGEFIRLLEHVTPLNLNSQGLITHCFKHFTDISHLPFTDNVTMSFIDETLPDAPVIHTVIVNSDTNYEVLRLSKREIEVLKVIAQGKTTKEIADMMHLSPDTIKNHRKNMLLKTGAKNISEVLSLAFVNQILE